MADRYVVSAPLIVVKVPGAQGGEAYMKRGRLLPTSVRNGEISRLLDLGLIEPDPVSLAEAAAAAAAAAAAERVVQAQIEADQRAAEQAKADAAKKSTNGK